MAVFVLIHGAWHGAWCWEKVVPLLKQAGHEVFAPDLPGHGQDKTPLQEITLNHYVNSVCALIDEINSPIILVGHSMAGIVISQVAEHRSYTIQKLVYLAAFLPRDGESMFTVAQGQPTTRFVKMMKKDSAKNAFYFPAKGFKSFAYHQCDKELFENIEPRFAVEPLLPCDTAVRLTEPNFGQIPRVYIECEEDKALLLASQQKIHARMPCTVLRLGSDHSPFYSDPKGLVYCLKSCI